MEQEIKNLQADVDFWKSQAQTKDLLLTEYNKMVNDYETLRLKLQSYCDKLIEMKGEINQDVL